jgi:type II secretory pathway pseudopilin PulG
MVAPARRRRARGFTYLTALFAVAFLGLGLTLAGETWRTAAQREREARLLWTGDQYRRAIERYYRSGPAQYPRSMEDLLRDPRQAGIVRHLRQRYPDPVTGSAQWGYVRTPAGEIMGVYSLSPAAPFKAAGFAVGEDFAGARAYSDWKFVFRPR